MALSAACLVFGGAASPQAAKPAASDSPGVAATTTAPAPPGALVLYDPAAPALPGGVVPVTACGGFATPCGGLQTTTTANASVTTPLLPTYYGSDWESGMNGVVAAGVSNHGTMESGAVTAWLKKGDTTVALTVGVTALQYTGKRYYQYPYGP